MAAVVSVAVLYVAFYARARWRMDRIKCRCSHAKNRHVSAWDWDSDYGDPQHVGPNYVKPGICRDCRCRFFIQEYQR